MTLGCPITCHLACLFTKYTFSEVLSHYPYLKYNFPPPFSPCNMTTALRLIRVQPLCYKLPGHIQSGTLWNAQPQGPSTYPVLAHYHPGRRGGSGHSTQNGSSGVLRYTAANSSLQPFKHFANCLNDRKNPVSFSG